MRKKVQPRKVARKTDQKVAPKSTEKVPLSEVDTLRLRLANERMLHANSVATTRKAEFETELARVVQTFQEGGKYVISHVNADTGEIERYLASEKKESPGSQVTAAD